MFDKWSRVSAWKVFCRCKSVLLLIGNLQIFFIVLIIYYFTTKQNVVIHVPHTTTSDELFDINTTDDAANGILDTNTNWKADVNLNLTDTQNYKTLCQKPGYSKNAPINHTSLGFNILEPKFCKPNIFILYFVQTAVKHRQKRDIIRETWGKGVSQLKPYQVLFVLGRSLDVSEMEEVRRESEKHRDIIQANFIDTYKNLTYKHLYAMQWITEHCSQAQYIFKTDDDVFINVFRVQQAIDEVLTHKRNFIYCEFAVARFPTREKNRFYQVPPEIWPDFRYPTHCQGLGYIMSNDVLSKLLHCSVWRHYLWIDDLFITGALRDAMNICVIKAVYGFDFGPMPKELLKLVSDSSQHVAVLKLLKSHLVLLDIFKANENAISILWNLLLNHRNSRE